MDKISDHIQHISALPPMPDNIIKIQKISNDPLSSLSDLVAIIQQDPMLTADILKLANSPVYSLKEHVNTLQQATAMFGLSSIVGFAMAFSIGHTLNVDLTPYGVTPAQFLNIAQTQNSLAYHWKDGLKPQEVNILLTASFLMEIGSLLISDYIIKENLTDQFRFALKTDKSISSIETEMCGFSHQCIGADMFRIWDFDEKIVNAISDSASIDPSKKSGDAISSRLAVISTAINLKEQFTDQSISSAAALAKDLGLDGDYFKQIVERVQESNQAN